MGTAAKHPADDTLRSCGPGELDQDLAESVHEHLESCLDCQRRVAQISSDSFLRRSCNAREVAEMFQIPETGSARKVFARAKFFVMNIQMNEMNGASVTVGGKTSFVTLGPASGNDDLGAVGVFAKSGSVSIDSFLVDDK